MPWPLCTGAARHARLCMMFMQDGDGVRSVRKVAIARSVPIARAHVGASGSPMAGWKRLGELYPTMPVGESVDGGRGGNRYRAGRLSVKNRQLLADLLHPGVDHVAGRVPSSFFSEKSWRGLQDAIRNSVTRPISRPTHRSCVIAPRQDLSTVIATQPPHRYPHDPA